jgi:hypothetical protein
MLIKLLKVSLAALTVLFIALQFSQPAKTNPVSDPASALQARAQVPTEVTKIFDRSCRDCHSNETAWPWYSRIAPVSWLVADDVRIGRQQLNFSEWGRYSERQAENKLEEICAVVRAGAMPPKKYTLAHPVAKLTANDVKAICAWTVAEQQRLAAQK